MKNEIYQVERMVECGNCLRCDIPSCVVSNLIKRVKEDQICDECRIESFSSSEQCHATECFLSGEINEIRRKIQEEIEKP